MPTVLSLTSTTGTVVPAADGSGYELVVNTAQESVQFQVSVPEGTTASLDGRQADSEGAWITAPLHFGDNVFALTVADGLRSSSSAVRVTRGGLDATLSRSTPVDGDVFGYSVAALGDMVAVGVPGDDGPSPGTTASQVDSGAVYVFRRGPSGWGLTTVLKASNAEKDDHFGWSVALTTTGAGAGLRTIVVVGAPDEDGSSPGTNGDRGDNSAPSSGAVYVFDEQGNELAYLKQVPVVGSRDKFGSSVAADDDVVVIGAPGEASSSTGVGAALSDNGAPGSGAAYVYQCPDGRCAPWTTLKASNTGSGDRFGYSVDVAVVRDANGGRLRAQVAVGAPTEDSGAVSVGGRGSDDGATDSGAVYVFDLAATARETAYVKASNTDPEDHFGTSVSISPTLLAVGASGEDGSSRSSNGNQLDNRARDAGAAYAYINDGGIWRMSAYLKASNADSMDQFGAWVQVRANRLLIGAPGESSRARSFSGDPDDNSMSASGAIYWFELDSGVFGQSAYLKAEEPAENANFGAGFAYDDKTLIVGDLSRERVSIYR